jgi:uncharacterized membrane protein
MTNLMPLVVLWAILAFFITVLAFYRRKLALNSDDTLHVLESDAKAVPMQQEMALKLNKLDRLGKMLTIVAVVWGLGLCIFFILDAFFNRGIPTT